MCVCACESWSAIALQRCILSAALAALALSPAPAPASVAQLALSLSFALSPATPSLSLFPSFPFFPSKLWQVGVDCDATAGAASMPAPLPLPSAIYYLQQHLVNEPLTKLKPPSSHLATEALSHLATLPPKLPLQLALLLSSSWQLHCLQCTSPVGETGKPPRLHCACPCLHYVQGSKTSWESHQASLCVCM